MYAWDSCQSGKRKTPVGVKFQLSIGSRLKAYTFSLTNIRHQPSPGSVFTGFDSAVTETESPAISCATKTDRDIMTATTNPNLTHFILKYPFPIFPFITICYMIKKRIIKGGSLNVDSRIDRNRSDYQND